MTTESVEEGMEATTEPPKATRREWIALSVIALSMRLARLRDWQGTAL